MRALRLLLFNREQPSRCENCPNTKFLYSLYFPVYGLNTEIYYSVNLCIQFKYGKIRTRTNSVFGNFLRNPRKVICYTGKTARVFHINSSKYFYIIISVFLQTQFLHLSMDPFLLFLFWKISNTLNPKCRV